MTRLPSLTPAQLVKALKRAGFVAIPGRGREVVIAMHAREMKRGTLTAIVRQAGFTQDEFQELL